MCTKFGADWIVEHGDISIQSLGYKLFMLYIKKNPYINEYV